MKLNILKTKYKGISMHSKPFSAFSIEGKFITPAYCLFLQKLTLIFQCISNCQKKENRKYYSVPRLDTDNLLCHTNTLAHISMEIVNTEN